MVVLVLVGLRDHVLRVDGCGDIRVIEIVLVVFDLLLVGLELKVAGGGHLGWRSDLLLGVNHRGLRFLLGDLLHRRGLAALSEFKWGLLIDGFGSLTNIVVDLLDPLVPGRQLIRHQAFECLVVLGEVFTELVEQLLAGWQLAMVLLTDFLEEIRQLASHERCLLDLKGPLEKGRWRVLGSSHIASLIL